MKKCLAINTLSPALRFLLLSRHFLLLSRQTLQLFWQHLQSLWQVLQSLWQVLLSSLQFLVSRQHSLLYVIVFAYVLVLTFACPATTFAQSERMQKLAVRIDTALTHRRTAHVDSNYISYPKRKLLVSTGFVNSWKSNEIYLPLDFDDDILERFVGVERYQYLRVRNYTYTSGIAFKVNYSGLSLGYTAIVSDGGNHQTLEAASNGRKIGFRAGVRRYELDNGTISDYRLLVPMLCARDDAHAVYDVDDVAKECVARGVDDQVDLLEWYASAYYVFNNRKFCIGATVNPNVTQRCSAGSVILAADVSSSRLHANNMVLSEREKYSSFAVAMGAGYGYNWTPNGGRLLMHATVMPTINLFTHIGYDAFAYHRNTATGKMEWERVKQNEDIPIVSKHKVSLALSGIVRLGLSYNFSPRVVGSANIECSVRNKNSNSSGCYTYNTRLAGNVMLGYRF